MSLTAELRQAINGLLQETTTLTLATVDPDGVPRATPLFFAFDRAFNFYFLSDSSTRHGLNLVRDDRAGAAVYPEELDWRQLRGLQLQGLVARLSPPESEEALAIYQARFPFLSQLADTVEASSIYCFQPGWIRYIDNRRGFGFKQEASLP
jgi:hypothetical protein